MNNAGRFLRLGRGIPSQAPAQMMGLLIVSLPSKSQAQKEALAHVARNFRMRRDSEQCERLALQERLNEELVKAYARRCAKRVLQFSFWLILATAAAMLTLRARQHSDGPRVSISETQTKEGR